VREDGFPSLAVRPAERGLSTAEPVHPPVAVPSEPALVQRVAALRQQAAEGDRAFDAAFGPVASAVAAAGDSGTESWVAAQQALSRLEAARVGTAGALRELDQLALERAAVATNEGDFAAIEAALAEVETLAAAQRTRWETLRDRLAR
jgi:hypothetical protein